MSQDYAGRVTYDSGQFQKEKSPTCFWMRFHLLTSPSIAVDFVEPKSWFLTVLDYARKYPKATEEDIY